ncbi:hypothetical protein KK120_19280 [Virgibacillus dakarensis]|nr:hypothetical protein [Virgibacillus dakarensis]
MVIKEEELRSHGGWTAYEGMNITGKVLSTYVRGTKVFGDGEIIGGKGYGQ